jgi:hypothetical protein
MLDMHDALDDSLWNVDSLPPGFLGFCTPLMMGGSIAW